MLQDVFERLLNLYEDNDFHDLKDCLAQYIIEADGPFGVGAPTRMCAEDCYLNNMKEFILDETDDGSTTYAHRMAQYGLTPQMLESMEELCPRAFTVTNKKDGKTLFHEICREGPDESIAWMCDKFPEGLGVVDHNGNYPLHDYCRQPRQRFMMTKHQPNLAPLLQGRHKMVLQKANKDGDTPLGLALRHGFCNLGMTYHNLVLALLQHTSLESKDGDPPAFSALKNGKVVVVKWNKLVEHVPEAVKIPNVTTGEYMLHRAVQVGLSAEAILAIYEAYPEAASMKTTKEGWYPLQLALAREDCDEKVAIALATPDALTTALADGSMPVDRAAALGIQLK